MKNRDEIFIPVSKIVSFSDLSLLGQIQQAGKPP